LYIQFRAHTVSQCWPASNVNTTSFAWCQVKPDTEMLQFP
jgi:hypothetical protein